jgi:hypothetical protein
MKNVICFILSAFSFSLQAQFLEDFSDGEFFLNPSWQGNLDSFEVNNEVLQLNAPPNSTESFLVSSSLGAVAGFWEFELRMDFNPSSGNRAKVYLMSDTNDLKAPLNGYFVLLGNADDEVSLYKQEGTSATKIIDGQDGILNRSMNLVKVRVERDAFGSFTLYADTSQVLNTYVLQGSIHDNSFLSSKYFGWLCDYTPTRSDKFYLDNIQISAQVYTDQQAPSLQSHQLVGLTEINLFFSENIDSSFALINTNYLVSNISLSQIELMDQAVKLIFNTPFQQNATYSMLLYAMDLSGNTFDTIFQFGLNDNYSFQSVLINEIYADENPSYGMPAYEFLELRNTSLDTIILEDWKIADAGDTLSIPNQVIYPLDYLILCKTTAALSYATFGRSLGVPNFPSLNNTGDALKLFNKYDGIIDSLTYNSSWYASETDNFGHSKKDGGFSLERISNASICSDAYNWFPSMANLGATPGAINTALNYNFPPINVQVDRLRIDNDTTLVVYLNHEAPFISEQQMGISNMGIEQAFSFDHRELFILLDQPLAQGQTYLLSFTNVFDCRGEAVPNFSFEFYNFDFASKEDLVINEVLFNPRTGGADYLELYNKSSKLINLEGFKILEYDALDPLELVDEVLLDEMLIAPREYVAFSNDTNSVFLNYIVEFPRQLFEINLPNFNDDQSIIVLKLPNGETADSLAYHKSWHLELLDIQDGAALERIEATGATNNPDNWQTAAKTYGNGTPTRKNSQSFEGNLASKVSVEPQVFTPNEDGYKDFCLIKYKDGSSGELANITIYNMIGQEVKLIAQNHSLGAENTWRWNGTNNDLEKAEVGIYIVLFEIFDLEGKRRRIKERVVLGTPLN